MSDRFQRRPIDYLSDCLIVVFILAQLGCRDRTTQFTPSVDQAQSALTEALQLWKDGKPAGEIPGSKPAIHVTDNHAQRRRVLESFRILGETPGRSGRTIAVELTLKQPDEVVKTEYIVVGIDPLWVFRREDYELLMHWDHRMPSQNEATSKP